MQEVIGSSPIFSTKQFSQATYSGCLSSFLARIGQRAAMGHTRFPFCHPSRHLSVTMTLTRALKITRHLLNNMRFRFRMHISSDFQSEDASIYICRRERFRLQTARAIQSDASGRPNRRPGPSNRPPRAFLRSDPTPSPSRVGSSSLPARLPVHPRSALSLCP